VFVALGIQHAMRICHIVICGLPRSTIVFHNNFIKGIIYKKISIENKNTGGEIIVYMKMKLI
jgi:hypothetical protein